MTAGFLQRWRTRLAFCFGAPSPRPLGPDAALSRLIFARSHLRPAAGRAHWAAFDPGTGAGLSCLHTTGLEDGAIWRLAGEVLRRRTDGKAVHGRADFDATHLAGLDLRALLDDWPFRRHVSVTGWPPGPEGKSGRILKAKRLAELAVLRLPPRPAERPR